MPFYELFCLGRAGLKRAEKADLFKLASNAVLSHGGVLTDLRNFGDRTLAYKVSRAGGRYSEAFTWQISFAASPAALGPLERELKLDERVLRHMVVKTQPFERYPSANTIGKAASWQLQLSAQQGKSEEEKLKVDGLTPSQLARRINTGKRQATIARDRIEPRQGMIQTGALKHAKAQQELQISE